MSNTNQNDLAVSVQINQSHKQLVYKAPGVKDKPKNFLSAISLVPKPAVDNSNTKTTVSTNISLPSAMLTDEKSQEVFAYALHEFPKVISQLIGVETATAKSSEFYKQAKLATSQIMKLAENNGVDETAVQYVVDDVNKKYGSEHNLMIVTLVIRSKQTIEAYEAQLNAKAKGISRNTSKDGFYIYSIEMKRINLTRRLTDEEIGILVSVITNPEVQIGSTTYKSVKSAKKASFLAVQQSDTEWKRYTPPVKTKQPTSIEDKTEG